MFDIGILELGLIAVVALLVIGPERLPAVARTIGFWFGKARKFVTSVQQDFNTEVLKAEELKRLVEEQSKIKDVHEILEKSVDDTRKTVAIGADLNAEDEDKELEQTPQIDSSKNNSKQEKQSNNKTADTAPKKNSEKD